MKREYDWEKIDPIIRAGRPAKGGWNAVAELAGTHHKVVRRRARELGIPTNEPRLDWRKWDPTIELMLNRGASYPQIARVISKFSEQPLQPSTVGTHVREKLNIRRRLNRPSSELDDIVLKGEQEIRKRRAKRHTWLAISSFLDIDPMGLLRRVNKFFPDIAGKLMPLKLLKNQNKVQKQSISAHLS